MCIFTLHPSGQYSRLYANQCVYSNTCCHIDFICFFIHIFSFLLINLFLMVLKLWFFFDCILSSAGVYSNLLDLIRSHSNNMYFLSVGFCYCYSFCFPHIDLIPYFIKTSFQIVRLFCKSDCFPATTTSSILICGFFVTSNMQFLQFQVYVFSLL